MSQDFKEIPSTETIAESRQDILNNDHTLLSNNAGTAFPTTNLEIGMECYRTDLAQMYMLKDSAPTWVMVDDLTKVPAYQDWTNSNFVNLADAVTSAQPNKLLRMNANGYLSTSITGNAATATIASAVAWNNVTSRPPKSIAFCFVSPDDNAASPMVSIKAASTLMKIDILSPTAPSASTTVTIYKNGSAVQTATFTTATYSLTLSSSIALADGDVLYAKFGTVNGLTNVTVQLTVVE